jgi:multiple sugar transport system substrate-binding protein
MTSEPIVLTGITWDHSRALPPLVAASQRYEELNPGIRIRWDKRSLHEFGHMPIEQLADRFDFVVIDHPWAAYCFARGLVHDLKPLLTSSQYEDLENNCIGPSFRSYLYKGNLLALPIDAATPTPSWRPDLLQKHARQVPQTLSEVIDLADAGLAVMPGFPADLFLNWSMLLAAMNANPFSNADQIADAEPAFAAMDLLKRLAQKMPAEIYQWNPIAIAEQMTRGDTIAYCAFAYSYGNYCRSHFTPNPLHYGNLVKLDDGTPLRSIVGGTGMAITRHCNELQAALNFANYCASAYVQSGIYTYAGGQPSRREAWQNNELDAFNGNFFSGSMNSHEAALLRPRYDGYVPLQEEAGVPLQNYLQGKCGRDSAWQAINECYRASLPQGSFPEL